MMKYFIEFVSSVITPTRYDMKGGDGRVNDAQSSCVNARRVHAGLFLQRREFFKKRLEGIGVKENFSVPKWL
ncbi:MAG: hypothetical protein HYZ34_03225 [Ignavibacteriae bacterium]|nr:hypothetical protein [Ignavibacteriota bacterium]